MKVIHRRRGALAAAGLWPFQFFIGCLLVAVLAVVWPYDSPRRLASYVCTILVYSSGFAIISIAKKRGYVRSVAKWNMAFLAKFVVSWAVLVFFWVGPLQPDQYRMPSGDHFDGMLYDYHAYAIVSDGSVNLAEHLNFTWLSFGVVGYAAIVYSIAGANLLNVAFCNCLIVLVMAISIVVAMSAVFGVTSRLDRVRWVMLLPFGSFYDAIVTKDTPCNMLFAVCLAATCWLATQRRNVKGAFLVYAVGLVGLAVFRINVAAVVLVCTAIVMLIGRQIPLRYIIAGAAAGGLCIFVFLLINPNGAEILGKIVNPTAYFADQQAFIDRASEGASPLRVAVANATVPKSLTGLVTLAPLRALIWLYSPYPEILPDLFNLSDAAAIDAEAPAKTAVAILGALSAWIICLESPLLFRFLVGAMGVWKKVPGYFVLWIFILVPTLLTSNLTFVGARRYRTMVEPLFFAIAVCGGKSVRPRRLTALLFYAAIFVPLVAYWSYKNLLR